MSIRSGHGVGKTTAVAGATLWHLECTDFAKVPCTAPTQDQLERVLWSELAKWFRKSDALSARIGLPRQLWLSSLFEYTATSVAERGSPKEWFAVARTSRKERPDALQGFHADDLEISEDGRSVTSNDEDGKLLFVIEEACFDDQTEILTDSGWKLFANLALDDLVLTMDPEQRRAYYEKPSRYFSYWHDGEMIEYRSRALSLCITPNHRMWAGVRRHSDSSISWRFLDADEAIQRERLVIDRRFTWDAHGDDAIEIPEWRSVRVVRPARRVGMDAWAEFLGWFLSEGSVSKTSGRPYAVVISQRSGSEEIHRIAECVRRIGFKPAVYGSQVRINSVQLASFLHTGDRAPRKRVPPYMFRQSRSVIKAFLESYRDGDGYQKGQRDIYYTSSSGMADDLQILIILSGGYASICKTPQNGATSDFGSHTAKSAHDKFVVGSFVAENATIRPKNAVRKQYCGNVYCVEVPGTHLVYVRRHGTCHWSGNSGVPDAIFEVAEGALTGRGARLLMPGNPVRNSGYFYRSHTDDRAHFTALHFSCDDSPLVDPSYRKKLARKFGEDSNIVRVRADGEFPKQDDDSLISVGHAEAAVTRSGVTGEGKKRLGVDVAEFGHDRTTLVVRHGRLVGPIEVHAKQETMVTVGKVVDMANRLDVDEVLVDCIGLGAGVASRLAELADEGTLKAKVVRVDVRRAAPRRADDADAQGFRLRDHLWLEAKSYVHHDEPSFEACEEDHAKDLSAELTVPRYSQHSSGSIVVEDKDSIKRRNEDRRSPDIAEGFLMTLYDEPAGFQWYVSD